MARYTDAPAGYAEGRREAIPYGPRCYTGKCGCPPELAPVSMVRAERKYLYTARSCVKAKGQTFLWVLEGQFRKTLKMRNHKGKQARISCGSLNFVRHVVYRMV
jgi:hypothetical protein